MIPQGIHQTRTVLSPDRKSDARQYSDKLTAKVSPILLAFIQIHLPLAVKTYPYSKVMTIKHV